MFQKKLCSVRKIRHFCSVSLNRGPSRAFSCGMWGQRDGKLVIVFWPRVDAYCFESRDGVRRLGFAKKNTVIFFREGFSRSSFDRWRKYVFFDPKRKRSALPTGYWLQVQHVCHGEMFSFFAHFVHSSFYCLFLCPPSRGDVRVIVWGLAHPVLFF